MFDWNVTMQINSFHDFSYEKKYEIYLWKKEQVLSILLIGMGININMK